MCIGHPEGEISMTEDKQVSNDNCAKKKAAEKALEKPIYADVSKAHKNPRDDAVTEKKEVVHWSSFSSK